MVSEIGSRKSVLLKHSFEEKQKIFNKTNAVTLKVRIENIFQNCWFRLFVVVNCFSTLM